MAAWVPARGSGAAALCRTVVLAVLLMAPGTTLHAQSRAVRDALADVDPERIRAHVNFLASDLLEGRGVGTRGGALAAEYIAAQFAQLGLRPLHDSWYQAVPLASWTADTTRTFVGVGAGEGALQLRASDGALLWPAAASAESSVNAELVFVGYGTSAPEYDWNDYEGDVRGRVVIVLAGDPPAPPGSEQLFEGEALTYYGRWTYKLEEAARRGAAAVLLVHTPDLAGYDWNVVRTGWSGAVVSLREDSAAVAPRVSGWLSTAAARRLLESAGLDFDQLFVRAARRDFTPVLTDTEVRVQAAGELRSIVSTNVAALLPGGDERYRTEVVVYTAHHDALGVGPPTGGDAIYNGAYDNAGGVAQLLEIAKAFTELRSAPDRSILFLATAAEEAGMLGATYYTRHPLVPLERTIAVLNLEGVNFWGETDDVSAVGIERSTLGAVFSRVAAALRLRATPERAPALGFFFRSDHFPFARAGIPAVSLDHGIRFRNRPSDWGTRTLADFLARAYHTPLDHLPQNADLSGATQQVRVAFLLGYDLAQDRERPRYYDDVRPLPPPAALRPSPPSNR